jgi:NAD(P)-dependent dehydrogenase (short-subunit alcohol dehydrogenase family)
LTGKVAVVTGASSGIGRGIAIRLAREGANVTVNYLKSDRLAEEVVGTIRGAGSEPLLMKGDVSDAGFVDGMIAETVRRFGRLDVLVNNAGIAIETGGLETVTDQIWDRIMSVNLKGTFLCIRRAVPEMLKNGSGRIINISSIYADVSELNTIAYCASKGGVNALTKALALELAPKGVTVNAIAPGQIETVQIATPDRRAEVIRRYTAGTPVGRIGQPEDIAAAAAYLASDESSFATGSVFVIDGGWTIQ